MAGWQSIASRLIYLLISACLAIIGRGSKFLDSQSQTRRPLFPALVLIACLALGTVVTPGTELTSLSSGRDASRSIDISLGRSSGSVFSHARTNKLQSNVSCNKKSVRAVTAGLSAAVGQPESRFLFSTSRLPLLSHHLSTGFGRSPPTLQI